MEDYAALADVNRAAMPGTDDTAESLREDDRYTSAYERWVAEVDGEVIGHAAWFQLPSRLHPRKFWLDGAVHPSHQGQGIGSELLQTVLTAIEPRNPISLRSFSREDYAPTLRFLGNRGFTEAKRSWESFLDLKSFQPEAFPDQTEALKAQGIRLAWLPELQQQPDWEERLCQLYNAIQTDVPDIDQAAAVWLEQFRKSYLGSGSFLPDGQLIALQGDRWIGLSTLWKGSSPDLMNTGLTGVLPPFRRLGLAMTLKLRSLRWAKEQGLAQISTSNASTNTGMLAINDRLGFQRRPAWLHLVRAF